MRLVWVVTKEGEDMLINAAAIRTVKGRHEYVTEDPVPGFAWNALRDDAHQDGWRKLQRNTITGREMWQRIDPVGCRITWVNGGDPLDITMSMESLSARCVW